MGQHNRFWGDFATLEGPKGPPKLHCCSKPFSIRAGLDWVALDLDDKLSAMKRNPPGRNLLRLTSHAVRTTSGIGGGGASTSAASPRPRNVAGGRPLRATSPPPPSAVAAATYWESRALGRDGEEEDWEEVVAGGEAAAPGPGEMDEEEEYRVVFWSPPTIDEVTGAITSIQE
jgi:hypothetical protein